MRAGERPPVTEAMPVADGEDVPRLSAVVERQRRELARARADGAAAVTVATARGVLMERQGLSLAEAARQLADMAAAAGLPQPEMAAAVLAEEPVLAEDPVLAEKAPAQSTHSKQDPAQHDAEQQGSARHDSARRDSGQRDSAPVPDSRPTSAGDASGTWRPLSDTALAPPGEWIEPGTLGPADDVLMIAAAERAKDGAELVGALAEQLRIAVRRRRGRGVAARRRRCARTVRRGRARRHRGEPLAAAAAAVRLRGAAGGRDRRRPVVARRAARGRPRARRRTLGPGRRPCAARPAGPVGDPARRGRGLVADGARGLRRQHPGLGVRRDRRVHRGARGAAVLCPRRVDGAVAGGLGVARPVV